MRVLYVLYFTVGGGGGQESLGRIMIHKRLVSPPVKESAPSSANPKRFLNIRGYKDF